jgi:hypothetical protein
MIGVMVDGVVLQQNKAELIGLYAIARFGLKDKYKLLVKKIRSYSFRPSFEESVSELFR